MNITQENNPIKYCRVCNNELVVGKNWTESSKNYGSYICKDCKNKKNRVWVINNPDYKNDWRLNNLDYQHKYYLSNKDNISKSMKEYSQSSRGKAAYSKSQIKYRQTAKGKLADKRYRYSNKGRNTIRKNNAKRQRNLGWELLFENPFPDNIQVHKHHISDGFIVYLPTSLHLNYLHGSNAKLHRQELKPFVESIYNVSYLII